MASLVVLQEIEQENIRINVASVTLMCCWNSSDLESDVELTTTVKTLPTNDEQKSRKRKHESKHKKSKHKKSRKKWEVHFVTE